MDAWKDVLNFPTYECMLSHGLLIIRIKRSKRVLKKHISSRGYPRYALRNLEGVIKYLYEHKVIQYNFPVVGSGDVIDHIDGDKANNNISNLRLVTQRENCQNTKKHRAGGLVGANLDKRTGKYVAHAYLDKKQTHLGVFDTELEAHQAYTKAIINGG